MLETPHKGDSDVQTPAATAATAAAVASDWLQLISIVLLGVVSYFLKRSMGTIDNLEKRVTTMETRVAVLLDRDRRRRLADYARGYEQDYEGDST